MQVRVPRLAWALLLWPLALSGCSSGVGGPPSDPYAWTCQQWKDAGVIQQGNQGGVVPAAGSAAGNALVSLGNDLHDGHLASWGDANGRKVSAFDETSHVVFEMDRLCNSNP